MTDTPREPPGDARRLLVEFLKTEAAEERKKQTMRLDSAAAWRRGTDADWKEGAKIARRMSGDTGPVPSTKQRQHSAEMEERIAARLGKRAQQFQDAAGELEAALSPEALRFRRACECAEPDPVMQADDKFYCHACSFETGARPPNLYPEDWMKEVRRLTALSPEADRIAQLEQENTHQKQLIEQLQVKADRKPQFLPPPFDKQELTRRVAGAVKSAMDAHGPITLENRSTAAKRITGELYAAKAAVLSPEAPKLPCTCGPPSFPYQEHDGDCPRGLAEAVPSAENHFRDATQMVGSGLESTGNAPVCHVHAPSAPAGLRARADEAQRDMTRAAAGIDNWDGSWPVVILGWLEIFEQLQAVAALDGQRDAAPRVAASREKEQEKDDAGLLGSTVPEDSGAGAPRRERCNAPSLETAWMAKQAKLRPMTDTERAAIGHTWVQQPNSHWFSNWFHCKCGASLPDLDPSWFTTPIVEGDEPCGCLVCTPHV